MKRELKLRSLNIPFSIFWRVSAGFPMKRELKRNLIVVIYPPVSRISRIPNEEGTETWLIPSEPSMICRISRIPNEEGTETFTDIEEIDGDTEYQQDSQ